MSHNCRIYKWFKMQHQKYSKLKDILKDKEEYNLCIKFYKLIKQSPFYTNDDLILYKSFIYHVLSKQNEINQYSGKPNWVSIKEYFNEYLSREGTYDDAQTLSHLFSVLKGGAHPFNFNIQKHFGFFI